MIFAPWGVCARGQLDKDLQHLRMLASKAPLAADIPNIVNGACQGRIPHTLYYLETILNRVG